MSSGTAARAGSGRRSGSTCRDQSRWKLDRSAGFQGFVRTRSLTRFNQEFLWIRFWCNSGFSLISMAFYALAVRTVCVRRRFSSVWLVPWHTQKLVPTPPSPPVSSDADCSWLTLVDLFPCQAAPVSQYGLSFNTVFCSVTVACVCVCFVFSQASFRAVASLQPLHNNLPLLRANK